MNSELITWITAIGTVLAAAAGFAVLWEGRRKRQHEAQQHHFQKIKEFVFEYHLDLLIGHYLPILEGDDDLLDIGSRLKDNNPSCSEWNYYLCVRPPTMSIVMSFGDTIDSRTRDIAYRPLLEDTMINHFPVHFDRWKKFESEFSAFAQICLERGQQWAKKLEDTLRLPFGFDSNPGVNYLRLAIYMHERLWRQFPHSLNLSEEPGKCVLRWKSYVCGQGTKFDMECCQRILEEYTAREKGAIQPILSRAQQLKSDVISLKEEIQLLLLQNKLPGRCSLIRM